MCICCTYSLVIELIFVYSGIFLQFAPLNDSRYLATKGRKTSNCFLPGVNFFGSNYIS